MCFEKVRVFFSTVCFVGLLNNTLQAQELAQISIDGVPRTYNFFIPSSWTPSDQYPLLFVLHGLTQTGSGVMEITNFNALAEEEHFIVCYPSGINNAWNANMNVSVSTADDIGFLETLVDEFINQYNIDQSRIYFCGFSNGGFMSFKFLCHSDICIAGVAAVSASMSDSVYNSCFPSHSTSVLQIHGTGDLVVPYAGSPSTGVSVNTLLTFWQSINQCQSNTSISDFPNLDAFDFSTAQEITYLNCWQSELKHVKINGGGHQWPGIDTWNGGVGTINMDFYSPEYIWNFLKGKTCQTLGLIETNEMLVEVFPNPGTGGIRIHSTLPIQNMFICDQSGKVIQKLNGDLSAFEIQLEQGVYYLQFLNAHSGERGVKKVIVN